MARTIAFLSAALLAMVSCIVAVLVHDAFVAWLLGYFAGVVLVLANFLTHPLVFGWSR